MALNYVTLTPDLFDAQGNIPVTGTASFTPSAVLTDASDLEIIGQQPIVASYRLAGLPPVSLLATDNTGPQPAGWTWGVTFAGITGAPAAFSFFLAANPVTYTATNANPAVFTVGSGSAPPNGTGISLLTGAPAGFTNGTTYFVVGASGSTFRLAAAIGGTAIASSSTGSGNMITVTQRLSNLTPAQSGTAFGTFMPLPSGTPVAGQVPFATGSGEASAWGSALGLQASTGAAGYTLVNGTGTILTWTPPNDGLLHRFTVFSALHVTSNETGGALSFSCTLPDGTAVTNAQLYAAGQLSGPYGAQFAPRTVQAGAAVTVTQSSALTGGAAVLWAEIWGS